MLEGEPHAELDHTLDVCRVGQRGTAGDAGDLSERARRKAALRVGEHSVVEDVARFNSSFQPPLSAHRERAEYRQVDRVAAGAVELVSPGVAEADAGRLG